MNEIVKSLFSRKSVRAYEKNEIEQDKKSLIISSALQAPSAGNMGLYSIINVTDQAIKDQLAMSCDNQPFIAKASLVLVFVADYQKWYDVFVDTCPDDVQVRKPAVGDLMLASCDALIAAQNTVVCAESLGIGSCYIGDILEKAQYHRELFNLPKYAMPVVMLCFGYPTEQQKNRVKPSRFDEEFMVFENTYTHLDKFQREKMHTLRSGKDDFDFTKNINAMMKRKWNSDFIMEMNRSVEEMIDHWVK